MSFEGPLQPKLFYDSMILKKNKIKKVPVSNLFST